MAGRNKSPNCKNGHPFTKENTQVRPNGARRCRTCHRAENRKYDRANVLKRREGQLKIKYDISAYDYEEMLRRQGNVCAICKEGSDKVFHVDHDHCTGEVRGLLCKPCNVGLGWFRDNRKALLEASEYLLQDSRSGQK